MASVEGKFDKRGDAEDMGGWKFAVGRDMSSMAVAIVLS